MMMWDNVGMFRFISLNLYHILCQIKLCKLYKNILKNSLLTIHALNTLNYKYHLWWGNQKGLWPKNKQDPTWAYLFKLPTYLSFLV